MASYEREREVANNPSCKGDSEDSYNSGGRKEAKIRKQKSYLMPDARVREIFDSLDLTKDGKVSMEELATAADKHLLGFCNTVEDYEVFMKTVDTQQNGYIEYHDFEKWVREKEKMVHNIFKLFDKNKSGHITIEDFKLALEEYYGEEPTDEQMRTILQRLDLDDNGTIEYSEFLAQSMFIPGDEIQVMNRIVKYAGAGFLLWRDDIPPPSAIQTLTAGFYAGCVSRTLTAPLDRLAMVMRAGGTVHQSTNPYVVLKSMIRTGGWRSLWLGNGINCIQVGPESALTFFFYEYLKHVTIADPSAPSGLQKFFIGGLAGFLAMTAVYPLYVAQTRLAVVEPGAYSSLWDFFRRTWVKDGPRAFTSGYIPSSVRIFPYKGIDMMGFLTLKEIFVPPGEEISVPQSLLFGATASAVSQVLTAPLLTARTKLMAQGESMGRPILYHGMIDVFKKTLYGDAKLDLKPEGFRGLYRGVSAYVLKMSSATALQFTAFEWASRFLRDKIFTT